MCHFMTYKGILLRNALRYQLLKQCCRIENKFMSMLSTHHQNRLTLYSPIRISKMVKPYKYLYEESANFGSHGQSFRSSHQQQYMNPMGQGPYLDIRIPIKCMIHKIILKTKIKMCTNLRRNKVLKTHYRLLFKGNKHCGLKITRPQEKSALNCQN